MTSMIEICFQVLNIFSTESVNKYHVRCHAKRFCWAYYDIKGPDESISMKFDQGLNVLLSIGQIIRVTMLTLILG